MSEKQILKNIVKYFGINEFVSRPVYNKYGVRAWKFFDFRLLETIIIVRENIGRPITINNYLSSGKFGQRGLRTNIGSIFKGKFRKGLLYLSGHVLGKAIDFDVKGMTAGEVRQWLVLNQEILPYKIRLEAGVNWVHLDVIYEDKNPKVYIFNP